MRIWVVTGFLFIHIEIIELLELMNCLFSETFVVLENYHSSIILNHIIVKHYHLVRQHIELEYMNKGRF